MKLFFALDIEEGLRQRLEDLSQRMQEWGLPARWTHVHDFHITLAYLGEVVAEELTYLLYNTEPIVAHQNRCTLNFPACGAFAGKKWPRIIYAAVEDMGGISTALHHELTEACTLKNEKSYLPHITLCRPAGSGKQRQWPELLEAYAMSMLGEYTVNSISLYHSLDNTSAQGQRYQKIETWSLL